MHSFKFSIHTLRCAISFVMLPSCLLRNCHCVWLESPISNHQLALLALRLMTEEENKGWGYLFTVVFCFYYFRAHLNCVCKSLNRFKLHIHVQCAVLGCSFSQVCTRETTTENCFSSCNCTDLLVFCYIQLKYCCSFLEFSNQRFILLSLSSPLLFSPPPHFIWLLCPSRWVWLYCYWAGVCWLAAVLLISVSSCAMWLCLCLCVFVDRWQCTVGGNASNNAEYIFMSVTSHFI